MADPASNEAELVWLERREEILVRAIDEMESHEQHPFLDGALHPDVPASLTWARNELARVRERIDLIGYARRRRST